jgi:hypothetical protein
VVRIRTIQQQYAMSFCSVKLYKRLFQQAAPFSAKETTAMC